MKKEFRKVFQSISYSLMANIVSMLVSVISVVVIPKILGIREYGYWQIYMFYFQYIELFHLGHIHGIYLQNGGAEYAKLNFVSIGTQFWLLTILQLCLCILLSVISLVCFKNASYKFIFILLALNLLLVIPKSLLLVILQATNRFNEYSKGIILERLIYGLFVIILLFFSQANMELLLIADVSSRLFSVALTIYYCREIINNKISHIHAGILEAITHIKTGLNLLFSIMASRLFLAVFRVQIQMTWGLETFAKVSLSLTISNILLVFSNAIGIVTFPALRNKSTQELTAIYKRVRFILESLLFGLLLLYFPVAFTLTLWLPKYVDSITYLALLFPICIYESKVAILIMPYFNIFRKEKALMKVNFVILAFSLLLSVFSIFVIQSIQVTILFITVVMASRCIASEVLITKTLGIDIFKEIIIETVVVWLFVSIAWFAPYSVGLVVFALIYALYIFINRSNLLMALDSFHKR